MVNRTKNTPSKKEQFIEQLQRDGNVTRSCEAVKLARSTVYGWKREQQEFAAQWDHAVDIGVGALEDEAVKRALKGSDILLIFLLKANKPEKYSDRVRQELVNPKDQDGNAVPFQITTIEVTKTAKRDDDQS
jgi:hypothetical protein